MLRLACGKYKILPFIIGTLLILSFVAGCTQKPVSNLGSSVYLGNRTKLSGCVPFNGLPDKNCTPGAVNLTVTKEELCTPGYTSQVRDVPENVKSLVYASYGIKTHTTGQYEVDHFIPLELGGSNDMANLWPEAASPTPGFHQKDVVENYLHNQMCSGAIDLPEAQREIAINWVSVYTSIAAKS